MKNIKKYIIIIVLSFSVSLAFTQTPPPPNNGTSGSGGTTPVGGGAPLGSDLLILVSTAIAYGSISFWRKKATLR